MPILTAGSVVFATLNATNAPAAVATNGTQAAPFGGAAAGAKPKAPITNGELVYDVDMFLLAGLAVFFLVLLPRAIVRFTHKREWTDGHFIHSVHLKESAGKANLQRRPTIPDFISPPYNPSTSYDVNNSYGQQYKEQWASETDVSHTYVSHTNLVLKGSMASARDQLRPSLPTHILGVSTMFPALSAFLRTNVHGGLTIGKAFILVCYSVIMLYAGLFMSDPLSQPVRAGFVAVSQFPVVVALGAKNNLVGMFIGFGYERVCSIPVFPMSVL